MKKVADQKFYAPILLMRFAKILKKGNIDSLYNKPYNTLMIYNPGIKIMASNTTGYFTINSSLYNNGFEFSFKAGNVEMLLKKMDQYSLINEHVAEQWIEAINKSRWNVLH